MIKKASSSQMSRSKKNAKNKPEKEEKDKSSKGSAKHTKVNCSSVGFMTKGDANKNDDRRLLLPFAELQKTSRDDATSYEHLVTNVSLIRQGDSNYDFSFRYILMRYKF